MILTPIDHGRLPALLNSFDHALEGRRQAQAVFRRVTAVLPDGTDLSLSTDPAHHSQALALCTSFGLGLVDVDPRRAFTWDGRAVATRMEPSVIIHEVGHYQCAAPARRGLIDFGLGAGPETGRKAEADAVRAVFGADADVEEGLSSLLGILWEAELGQPAVLAFLEQNWLEGGVSRHNIRHFADMVAMLAAHGLIDPSGRPTRALRQQPDSPFFTAWHSR